jgi:ankyrin repeat protein
MDADASLRRLIRAIVAGDDAAVERLLRDAPDLARAALAEGASRTSAAAANFLPSVGCYLYVGATALQIAAAAYRPELCRRLIAAGASVAAKNRRGWTALHHAADSHPNQPHWDPGRQAQTIAALAAAGADLNALDGNGTTPLHRAIRTRGAAAVAALLEAGADPAARTRNGTTSLRLANVTSGRGGSGSPRAKAEQARIVELLEEAGAPA